MLNRLQRIRSTILNIDNGLLMLRVWFGIVLFCKHGVEKIVNFKAMQAGFPDPIGIGATPGLVFAFITDVICSIVIVTGFYTRLAAFLQIMNLLVVFIFLHKFSFTEEHAEIVYLYLGGFTVLLCCGPGRHSIDLKFLKRKVY